VAHDRDDRRELRNYGWIGLLGLLGLTGLMRKRHENNRVEYPDRPDARCSMAGLASRGLNNRVRGRSSGVGKLNIADCGELRHPTFGVGLLAVHRFRISTRCLPRDFAVMQRRYPDFRVGCHQSTRGKGRSFESIPMSVNSGHMLR
jgi:hypothetical protein